MCWFLALFWIVIFEFLIVRHDEWEQSFFYSYEGIERAHELACFIDENPKITGELLNYFGGDLDEAKKAINECYNSCYSSVADYAQELTEDTSEIPDHLVFYIDYEKMGRDMELNGDIFTIETAYDEVHIFWSHWIMIIRALSSWVQI